MSDVIGEVSHKPVSVITGFDCISFHYTIFISKLQERPTK